MLKKQKDFLKLINLKEWEFEFQQRERHPVLMADQWCRALWENYEKEIKLPVGGLDYLFTASSKGYVKKEQKRRVISSLKEAIKDQKYLDYIYSTTLKRIEELDNFTTKCLEQIKLDLNAQQLVLLWEDFNEIFLRVIPWFYIPWYLIEENILTNRVKEGLSRHKEKVETITDLNNALMALIFPTKKAVFQQEQKDFFALAGFAKKEENFEQSAKFQKQADKYLKKYAWMRTFFALPIEPLARDELIDRIKSALNSKKLEEFQLQKQWKRKNTKLAQKLIDAIQNDRELLTEIEQARSFGWLLTASVEKALYTSAKLIPFYKSITQKIHIPYAKLVHLTIDEIRQRLNGEGFLNNVEIHNREHSYLVLMEQGKATLLSGSTAEMATKWFEDSVGMVDINRTEFSGQLASPGKTKGKARISKFATDSKVLKEGEILVCSMTSPDYILAIRRAAAIVTDEGGILCHAAIVSRELRIPCIIGTKIATKVLKDGDLIEVDANRGVVRVLKRK